MDSNDDAYRRGLELLDTLHGGHVGEVMVEEMKAICPDFATMTIEWAISGIMGRPGLDLATRELLLVASCVTSGNAQPQLRAHIESAAKLGVSREKMIESLLTLLFYAGGPSVRNALIEVPNIYGKRRIQARERELKRTTGHFGGGQGGYELLAARSSRSVAK